jgi:HK97 family phage major capsid protein
METTDKDFLTELRQLFEDQKKNVELMVENRFKGLPFADLVEKQAKLEGAVATMVDKAMLETELRSIKERLSRGPAMLPGGGEQRVTLGARLTTTPEFKNFNFSGRFGKFTLTMEGQRAIQTPERKFISEANAGLVMYPTRVGLFSEPTAPLIIRSLLDVVALTTGNAVEYVYDHWVDNADYQIAEGDRKAEGSVTYTDATAIVRTIAEFVKVSRQMIADVPFIQNSIETRLEYGIAKKEDRELLYGDGAAGHIRGIMPQATDLGAQAGFTNDLEKIWAGIVSVMSKGYVPSAVVVNPLAWGSLVLLKNDQGLYLLGGPPAAEAQPRIWGLPVVTTAQMAVASFLVGAFRGNATLFDREQTTVDIAFENEDDFVRNLVTIRGEERITLAVYVPAAFAKGTLTITPIPALTETANGGNRLEGGSAGRIEGGAQGVNTQARDREKERAK